MPSNGRNPLVSPDAEGSQSGDATPRAGAGKRPHNAARISPMRATQRDVAAYVEHLAADLRLMSQSVDLDSLAYFLEMARLEASIQVERLGRSIGRGDLPQDV